MDCIVRTIRNVTRSADEIILPVGTVGKLLTGPVFQPLDGGRPVRLSARRLFETIVVLHADEELAVDPCPSYEELEAFALDSVCPSITGSTVEPDGHGPDGAPSWLLLLGAI